MAERYDVVIVGAGPAGLKCAEMLSGTDKKVLLIEKNKVIGPKVCAGGLTRKDIAYLNPPEKIIGRQFKEIAMSSRHNRAIIKRGTPIVYTSDRRELGQWQLSKLGTNIVVKKKCLVSKIEKDSITTKDGEIFSYDYLVGADGANSIVRRHLGIKTEKLVMAMQYIVPGNKYKTLEFFIDSKLFKAGYSWIFPHRNFVSVGCCADPKMLAAGKLKENFHKWLKKKKIDVSTAKFEAHPINYDYKGYKFGNIFLTGCAAGLSSGLTGEGIYQAMISGAEVAKHILDNNYVSKKLPKIIKSNKLHEMVMRFFNASKFLRTIEYELLILIMGTKWGTKKSTELLG